jgi:predicted Zn-dependent protease
MAKYTTTMLPSSPKPLKAPLLALLLGLLLSCAVSVFAADDLPEVQRLMKQGQLPQALEKVDAYVAGKPKDPQGRFLKGLILTEMGRSAEAMAVFGKLTEDFPELPEPYNNLAVLHAQLKTVRQGPDGARDGDSDASGLCHGVRKPGRRVCQTGRPGL